MSVIDQGVMTLVQNGLVEMIVFALIFAVVFGILRKIKFLAPKKKDSDERDLSKVKSIHAIISLVMGALVILPHYYARYSAYDIIPVVEQAFPKLSLLMVALIGVFVLLGLFGLGMKNGSSKGNPFRPVLFLIVVGIVFWIFGGSIDFWNIPYWLTPDIIAVVIAVAVFGLVVSYIMGPGENKGSIADATDGDKIDWKKVKLKDIIDDVIEKK